MQVESGEGSGGGCLSSAGKYHHYEVEPRQHSELNNCSHFQQKYLILSSLC